MRIVPITELRPGMVLGRTILGGGGQILLRRGVTLTAGYINFLQKYPLSAVYISSGTDVVAEDVISDETRLAAIQGTREMLNQVKRGAGLAVQKANELLLKVIDELLLQDEIVINLVDLRSFDEDLFHHSVNVAILSLVLGIENKYGQQKLKRLAQAALLHDIGRLFSEDENIYSHVNLGVDFLRQSGISPSVLRAILHHHERWDGAGFPNRLRGEEIDELARAIQVANAFDKLSANNRYPMEEVIEYLMAESGRELEPLSVRNFLRCVSFYPVGTMVELNTKERGVVIKANKGFPTRPVVRIERDMFGKRAEPGYTVNLLERPTYFVKRKLEAGMD
ncbi:MAG TPA: HD domain-containing protein [Firmicutes bacterium]|nr:HD domain-containing protein [Bacillota bacterium]